MSATLKFRRDVARYNAEMAQRAHELLDAHPHFRGRSRQFEFVHQEDVLVVRGCVATFYLKQILQTVLKDLDGVRLIENQVTVISSGGFSDLRERITGPIA